MELLILAGAIALFYGYAGYPLLLRMLAPARLGQNGKPTGGADCPTVAILLSVYNEEVRIRAKLENFASLDYPREKLELCIGSDGSTDRTAEVVAGAADARVRFVDGRQRCGKTVVLNRLAAQTEAQVLVFTDVNAMFRPEAIQQLSAMLAEPGVGLVSGRTVAKGPDGSAAVESVYYRYEHWVKELESRHGCLGGADGAIYAMRAELYEPLARERINDLSHPCEVVLRGWSVRFAPGAVCEEVSETGVRREMDRQTRMAAQAVYVYWQYIGALIGRGHFRFAWALTSHKLVRWLGFLWMLMIAIGSVGARHNAWGPSLLVAEGVFLALAAVAAIFPDQTRANLFRIPWLFLAVHWAYARGFLKFLSGHRYVTWGPRAG